MAGRISQEGNLFKVTFPFSGEQHEVHSLGSLAEAGLVGMALAAKAAEELQQALDAATPGVQGQPSFRLPKAAGLGAFSLPSASFSQLVEQLQACVDWHNKERPSMDPGPYIVEENDSMAPLCGLLAAAASLGCAAAVHLLAQLSPAAVSSEWPGLGEGSAAHRAAQQGHAEALRALLAAVPGAALAKSRYHYDSREYHHDDWSVMHSAAEGGSLEAMQVLLEAAPHTAAAVTDSGLTPLHVAAAAGQAPVVQALLRAAPEAALMVDAEDELPLHWGATHVEVVQLLLAAAPGTAMARTEFGHTALHRAAGWGTPASARALLQAAPEAACVADNDGHLPLWFALLVWNENREHLPTLGVLVAAAPSPATLSTIVRRGMAAAPLFADFIIAAPPLTAEQWACVPASCPCLGRALPAALAHSHEQACQLVRRLPPADATRLRTSALALARLQCRLRMALPGEVAGRLLGLSLAD